MPLNPERTKDPATPDAEDLVRVLGALVGTFGMGFDPTDTVEPTATPWTVTFTHKGSEHRFAGWDQIETLTWAVAFCEGRVDDHGIALTKRPVASKRRCPECSRVFDLADEDDADEFYSGHDCEAA